MYVALSHTVSFHPLQAAAQREAEAHRRVEKARQKRLTGRAAIVRTKQALRADGQRERVRDLPLKLDLRSDAELAQACCQVIRKCLEECGHLPPPHRQRFSHRANQSWQRGAKVLALSQDLSSQHISTYFPTLTQKEEAPFMYPRMRPGYIWRKRRFSPSSSRSESDDSADDSSSSTVAVEFPHPVAGGTLSSDSLDFP